MRFIPESWRGPLPEHTLRPPVRFPDDGVVRWGDRPRILRTPPYVPSVIDDWLRRQRESA